MQTKPLIVGFVIFILICQSLHAVTIRIPQDQPTIQAGIDAAADGDTVSVVDGVYTGEGNVNIDFKGKGITIKSVNGALQTIIDCQKTPNTRGFIFQSRETTASVLDGFTIKNGVADSGGGISCKDSSPAITNCIITQNTATARGYSEGGGGIHCINSSPTIADCTISQNTATSSGGGMHCTRSSATITRCVISQNTTDSVGGGVYCGDKSRDAIVSCAITQNKANMGGGIGCWFYNAPTIADCTIAQNTVSEGGGGISCMEYAFPNITNCLIKGNTANQGGGLYSSPTSQPRLSRCIIAQNRANGGQWRGGGGIYCSATFGGIAITSCTITQNMAENDGGGILAHIETGHFEMRNTIVWGNTAGNRANEIIVWRGIIMFCDIRGGQAEIGVDNPQVKYENNIDADPRFVNADKGDYRLRRGSPCIGPPLIGAADAVGDPLSVTPRRKAVMRWGGIKKFSK